MRLRIPARCCCRVLLQAEGAAAGRGSEFRRVLLQGATAGCCRRCCCCCRCCAKRLRVAQGAASQARPRGAVACCCRVLLQVLLQAGTQRSTWCCCRVLLHCRVLTPAATQSWPGAAAGCCLSRHPSLPGELPSRCHLVLCWRSRQETAREQSHQHIGSERRRAEQIHTNSGILYRLRQAHCKSILV